MKVKLPTNSTWKKIGVVVIGVIAATELLPWYNKAKAKATQIVKGA
jgi:hypothetical protein